MSTQPTTKPNWTRNITHFAHTYGYQDTTTGQYQLPVNADGGYPIVYLNTTDDTICPTCATIADHDEPPIADYFIHYEGSPEYCTLCDAIIPSAYGDPDNDDTESEDVPS